MKNLKRILVIALAAMLVLAVFTACKPATPENKLLGVWRDSTGFTGYEFKEGGRCVVTFADMTIPFINVDFNGDVEGVYTTQQRDDGNYYVTITYTIYSKSITKDFMFIVDGSSLTLTDTSDNSVTVYIAANNTAETVTAAPTVAQ